PALFRARGGGGLLFGRDLDDAVHALALPAIVARAGIAAVATAVPAIAVAVGTVPAVTVTATVAPFVAAAATAFLPVRPRTAVMALRPRRLRAVGPLRALGPSPAVGT